jgi:hypothetical protein
MNVFCVWDSVSFLTEAWKGMERIILYGVGEWCDGARVRADKRRVLEEKRFAQITERANSGNHGTFKKSISNQIDQLKHDAITSYSYHV